jgi:hypothetical protein
MHPVVAGASHGSRSMRVCPMAPKMSGSSVMDKQIEDSGCQEEAYLLVSLFLLITE